MLPNFSGRQARVTTCLNRTEVPWEIHYSNTWSEGKKESMSTLYPGQDRDLCTDPLHCGSWRCWQAQTILPGIEDWGGKDKLQPMLVHLTCFELKNCFCGFCGGGSGGNPSHQIFNLSFSHAFRYLPATYRLACTDVQGGKFLFSVPQPTWGHL